MNKSHIVDIRIQSVPEFLTHLETLPHDPEFPLFFRGHSDAAFNLLPGVYRNSGWIKNEDVMLKELILRCSGEFTFGDSTFQTLVRMQHYSLPTRLLDITENPLIALFFACHEERPTNRDGEVIVFRIPRIFVKYFDSDTVSVIANISRCPAPFEIPRRSTGRKQFNANPRIHHLLHEIKKEKPYFEPWILPDHLESVICVKPRLDNARILRQDGAFLLFGISGSKLNVAELPLGYTTETRKRRLLINAADKTAITKQLSTLGITPGTVYPEIDAVAKHIKTTYQSRRL